MILDLRLKDRGIPASQQPVGIAPVYGRFQ